MKVVGGTNGALARLRQRPRFLADRGATYRSDHQRTLGVGATTESLKLLSACVFLRSTNVLSRYGLASAASHDPLSGGLGLRCKPVVDRAKRMGRGVSITFAGKKSIRRRVAVAPRSLQAGVPCPSGAFGVVFGND